MREILEWELKNGDEKLRQEIENTKSTFDNWYKAYWSNRCTREKMLSPESPVEPLYYKMCKSFDEVKEKYPLDAKEKCSSCNEYVDEWIETSFNFCGEYGCGMSLCKNCAKKLNDKLQNFVNK